MCSLIWFDWQSANSKNLSFYLPLPSLENGLSFSLRTGLLHKSHSSSNLLHLNHSLSLCLSLCLSLLCLATLSNYHLFSTSISRVCFSLLLILLRSLSIFRCFLYRNNLSFYNCIGMYLSRSFHIQSMYVYPSLFRLSFVTYLCMYLSLSISSNLSFNVSKAFSSINITYLLTDVLISLYLSQNYL